MAGQDRISLSVVSRFMSIKFEFFSPYLNVWADSFENSLVHTGNFMLQINHE